MLAWLWSSNDDKSENLTKQGFLQELQQKQTDQKLAEIAEKSYHQKFVTSRIKYLMEEITMVENPEIKQQKTRLLMDFVVENKHFLRDQPHVQELYRTKLHELAAQGICLKWHYSALFGESLPPILRDE